MFVQCGIVVEPPDQHIEEGIQLKAGCEDADQRRIGVRWRGRQMLSRAAGAGYYKIVESIQAAAEAGPTPVEREPVGVR